MIKSIIILIPSVTWKIIIQVFIRTVLFYSIWINTGRCIHNTLFLWYITAGSRYFIIFNFLYIKPRTLCWANTKNLWCNSTCYKTKNLGARKWIFLMPQMTVNISDVFGFPDKFINIKWTILVIKQGVLSTK